MRLKFWKRQPQPRRRGQVPLRRRVGRIIKALLTDEDTYVLSGVLLLSSGVTVVAGLGYGISTAGASLFGFGLWLGYWHLSARREQE